MAADQPGVVFNEMMAWARVNQSPCPQLAVLSGPSGVGKDELLHRMRELAYPFHFPVTATTRAPRPNERNGVDYHFLDLATYDEWVAHGEFIERAQVYGNYYGVPKREVRGALDGGRDVILRIDVQGAAHVREIAPEAILIFLAPPDAATLEHRLRQRRTEDEASLQRRLAAAKQELLTMPHFDYVVTNHEGQQDRAAREVMAIIQSEKYRFQPRRVRL